MGIWPSGQLAPDVSLLHQNRAAPLPHLVHLAGGLPLSDHAGFAAAVTVREQVLKTALLAAYANGSFPTTLTADLPGGPPEVATDLFLGRPEVTCEGATNLLVLSLSARGPLRVTADGMEHTVQIAGQLQLTIRLVFVVVKSDSSLQLRPTGDDIVARQMTVSVTSAGTPADIVAYLTGEQFKSRMQQAIRTGCRSPAVAGEPARPPVPVLLLRRPGRRQRSALMLGGKPPARGSSAGGC
jgi:hypothetical protein